MTRCIKKHSVSICPGLNSIHSRHFHDNYILIQRSLIFFTVLAVQRRFLCITVVFTTHRLSPFYLALNICHVCLRAISYLFKVLKLSIACPGRVLCEQLKNISAATRYIAVDFCNVLNKIKYSLHG